MKYSCGHDATYKEMGIDYKSNLIETLQQKQIEALKAQVNYLRNAILDAISFMSGGEAKAKLRDTYDATPEQCLAEVKAQAINDMVIEFNKTRFLGTSMTNLISDYVRNLLEQAKCLK